MAGFRASRLLVTFSVVACCLAQDLPQTAKKKGLLAPGKLTLDETSTVDVPSLPADSIGAPLLCDPDGRIVFRLATPGSGIEDPVSASRDGKTVIRFSREKIIDIPRPSLVSVFLLGSGLYALTRSGTALGYETTLRTPSGEIVTQHPSMSGYYVAHFESDGTYAGAVSLDLPFHPLRLGTFDNGDFLIAGVAPTYEPRLAIVASNGQFRRFVELEGDVHAQDDSSTSDKGMQKDPTALSRFGPPGTPSLNEALGLSQFAKDGPNLLLFRPMNGPVFSISPSGEVKIHKLQVPSDYRLYTIKATKSSWIVEFLHNVPNSPAVEMSAYAFDPESGAPVREYIFPRNLGWGLACSDGDEFTFVTADDKTNTLKLVGLRREQN
jgi:hypothetical protein